MKDEDSKTKAALSMLKRRWLSNLEAAHVIGLMSLSQRVSKFRRSGINVIDRWVESDGSRFKQYRIPRV